MCLRFERPAVADLQLRCGISKVGDQKYKETWHLLTIDTIKSLWLAMQGAGDLQRRQSAGLRESTTQNCLKLILH